MRKLLLLPVFISFLFGFIRDNQQGVRFLTTSWSQVSKIAHIKQKPIFIFVAGEYCHLSKDMSTQVFTKRNVSDYLNRRFVCMKMDPKIVSNHIRLTNWGVTSVPSLIFLNPDGKKIAYKTSGYKDDKLMLNDAEKAFSLLESNDVKSDDKLTVNLTK